MHQPLRYWPGPPPFAAMSANWSGGGGGFAGGGATGTYGSQQMLPFNNEQVTTLATGLICIGSADGRIIPLVPLGAQSGPTVANADASPLSTGLVCILSNGKVVPAGQQQATPFSNGPSTAATGLICIWGTDGKIIPLNMCGGG